MSSLGFVKSQRVPTQISGEDELFQKELSAIKLKLQAAPGRAAPIHRAGRQPAWMAAAAAAAAAASGSAAASNAAAASSASAAAEALRQSTALKLQQKMKEVQQSGDVHRARRVESSQLTSSSSSAAAAAPARRPVAAAIISRAGGRDVDGDAEMADQSEDEAREDEMDQSRHGGGRRRPVEATIIVAAAASTPAASEHSAVRIDTSQLEVSEAVDSDQDADALAEERELAERRRRARAKAAEREAEEAARLAREAEEQRRKEEEEAEEEEEEEEEDESDSDDERKRMLLKPIFRSKAQRDTLADRERQEAEEAQLETERLARAAERKQQSKLLVVAELTKEVALEKARALQAGADSDADMAEEPLDEELELDLWKLRELKRLKRDRDERKAAEAEEAMTERRRGMTDAEIARDNARLGLERVAAGTRTGGDEPSMRFMQRYYHKGAFFVDENAADADLRDRDFHAPTGMDRTVDKASLPAVMQVKNFALKGRTKYTHLVDQDTTRKEDNPWARGNTLVENRAAPKGAGDVIPSHRNKKQRQ